MSEPQTDLVISDEQAASAARQLLGLGGNEDNSKLLMYMGAAVKPTMSITILFDPRILPSCIVVGFDSAGAQLKPETMQRVLEQVMIDLVRARAREPGEPIGSNGHAPPSE